MLWTIVVILLVMWLLGFSFHIAGGLIHLLLVVALVVLVFNLVTGRRAQEFMKHLLWIFQFAFGCHHRQLSRVFTIKKRTYQVCVECGREFEYSWASDALRAVERC